MGVVHFVFCTIGKCMDIICFLLDLNFFIVNSMIRFLAAFISTLNNLPTILNNSMTECWNLSAVCLISMVDGVSVMAQSSLNMLGRWLHLLGGVLESFKMVGYLSSHVLLRTKELLHRALLSGHGVLRHVWEGCGIALSLALYFVNTVVNLLLIGTQNLYALVVSLWEAVSCPLQKAVELTLKLLTFLYSSLVGTSILLWTPCRLAIEFLGSLGHIFVSVFLLNIYGFVLTAAIVSFATLYLNPELPRRAARCAFNYMSTVPALRRLQRALYRLYQLEMDVWQGLAWQGSRFGLGTVPGFRDNTTGGDGNTVGGAEHPDATRGQEAPVGGQSRSDGPPQPPMDEHADPAFSSSSTDRPLQKKLQCGEGSKAPPAESLLTLLKEQEERKKCVICQDSTKTVVLLPCRHLCLCRDCTNILLRQPIYQHNCPLCRHMILQTMDVYL